MNVNSWSPDGRRFAYVTYEPVGTAAVSAPWAHADVGDVSVKGDALSEGAGGFSVTGTLDVWGKADGCHFVYRPVTGDVTLIARVVSTENTNNHAKAGVMVRESLDAGAREACMVVTPVDGTQFLRRKEAGGLTTNTNPGLARGTLPRWVKLVRKGDTFTAFESADGTAWVEAGTDSVPMPAAVFVGVLSSSHQKEVTNTSKLDHVSVSAEATPGGPPGSRPPM
jgi:hypothetical protein